VSSLSVGPQCTHVAQGIALAPRVALVARVATAAHVAAAGDSLSGWVAAEED